ncbi:MAG TPA: lipid-A-disaccharide synthase [Candidatus Binataceae bacterium]
MASRAIDMRANGNARAPAVFLVAGEVSGDQNAALLADAIRRLAPGVRLMGAGGAAMSSAGVDVQVHTADLHFMGVPSVRAVISMISAYLRVLSIISKLRPDVVVFIDNESTNLFLANRLHRKGIPIVFFFPPQVWFWGRWRIPRIARIARRVISAFAEEASFYHAAGADTVCVGHPLRDSVRLEENPAEAIRSIGLDPSRPIAGLMPGSRRPEVAGLLQVMLDTARILKARDESLQFALPLASESFRDEVERAAKASGLRDLAIYRPRSYAVLSQAQVLLQCSGTASLEAALLGIPSVVAYRSSRLVHFVARRMMYVRYISITNLLLHEMVQPEFFNKNLDAEHLAEAVWPLLKDPERRRAIKVRLAAVRDLLGPAGVSARAAKAVLDLLPINSAFEDSEQPAPETRAFEKAQAVSK